MKPSLGSVQRAVRRAISARIVALALGLACLAGPLSAQAAPPQPSTTYAKAPPLPDLTGKVVLITGSTDGLGRDVARRIAAAGAHVLITGRSAPRGDSLVAEISKSGKGSARFYRADLASLEETRRLAEAVIRDNKRLDVLINNAGVGFIFDSTRKFSAEGYEMHFAVNYLAHYLLTKRLLPLIVASAPARIINVSSGSQTAIDFDDVMMTKGYNGGRGYAQSKLAQVMMTIDMAPALEKQGILTYSLHPATTMGTTMALALKVKPRSTIAEGVESVINAMTTTEPTGTFFNQLKPWKAQAQAYDAAAREKLRVLSEQLAAASGRRLGPRDVDTLPSRPAQLRAAYGTDSLQFGELRLPSGPGPFPVAVVIHGGCWTKGFATLKNTASAASALLDEGIATWNIEYRQMGDPGAGWPGSFTDVGTGIDYLRTLAATYPLDVGRVVVIGHSAGAHLALWGAGRPHLAAASSVRGPNPLIVRAAVAIDGPGDLGSLIGPDARICGKPVIAPFMGGTPDQVPDRYREASPKAMLPLGAHQYLVSAAVLPLADAEAYETAARARGDSAAVLHVPAGGHFGVIAPGTPFWPPVREFIRRAFGLPR